MTTMTPSATPVLASPHIPRPSLFSKMKLEGEAAKTAGFFLSFLTLSDMHALCQTSVAYGGRPPQKGGVIQNEHCAQALKIQMESRGTASLSEIQTYERFTGGKPRF